METRYLGNSDMDITPIGFGAWQAGGGNWQFGWGRQDDKDSTGAIIRAFELGVNWIDTAAVYGLGHSEEVLSRALAMWRDVPPFVFTKCGMTWDVQREIAYSLKEDSVRRECENSLRRLKLDVIDMYQIHWPADDPDETDEGWATLAALQQEGKVRWIGVSNFSVAELERAQAIAPITALQAPYSLIKREVENEQLPWCQANDVGVIVYSPMGSGLLSGSMSEKRATRLLGSDWRSKSPEFQEPKLSQNLAYVEQLKKVAARHKYSPGQAAIAWTLRHPAVTGAIVGSRNSSQSAGSMSAGDWRLTPAEIEEIEDVEMPVQVTRQKKSYQ